MFSYNIIVHSTTNFSLLEIVNVLNILTLMDLILLLLEKKGKFRWLKEDKDGETNS